MSKWPWMLGGAAAAYWWSRPNALKARARPAAHATPRFSSLPGDWVWPVATWNGRRSVISDGFNSPRPGVARHGGVDIMFKREPGDTYVAGSPNASRMFVMPDDHAVLAASEGVVWSAMPTPNGHAVVIDHGPRKVSTFYTHLDKLFVDETAHAASKQHVRTGQPIGTVGFSPRDAQKLKHLHFEVWLGGPSQRTDPARLMSSWQHLTAASARPRGARNGGFYYRPVGASGEAYPTWVRELKGESGVYLIRDRSGELLYVGSSRGRLYDTLTRHFQRWRRWKGFWKGQYGEGHDPGLTYQRDKVEVAIRLTKADDALDEEARLIQRLSPRDNLIGQPVEDEVPF